MLPKNIKAKAIEHTIKTYTPTATNPHQTYIPIILCRYLNQQEQMSVLISSLPYLFPELAGFNTKPEQWTIDHLKMAYKENFIAQ
jgi:hypothetical protein